MLTVVLVIHLLVALALVGVVMLQRSEGGGLGMGTGGLGNLMTARGTANLLTRTTAVLAACFMSTSIALAILSGSHSKAPSIVESIPAESPTGAPTLPAAPAQPAPPAGPAAPVAE